MILRSLFVHVQGACLRRTADMIGECCRRSCKAVRDGVPTFRPVLKDQFSRQDPPAEWVLVVDETKMIPKGRRERCVRITIDPPARAMVCSGWSTSRSILTAMGFLKGIRKTCGRLPQRLWSDGGVRYPFAGARVAVEHEVVSDRVRNPVKRVNEPLMYRAPSFDSYFPCATSPSRSGPIVAWVGLVIAIHDRLRPHPSRGHWPPIDRFGGSTWNRLTGAVRPALSLQHLGGRRRWG